MNRPLVPTPLQQEIWGSRHGLRDRLCSRYALFVHETEHTSVAKIALSALEARNPGSGPHDELIAAFGYSERKWVCVHPLGSFLAKSTKQGPFSLLAILPAAVPAELTLDWSYAGTWPLPDLIETDEPDLTTEEIFLQVIQRRGSVAILSDIGPAHLHVLCGTGTNLVWRPLLPLPADIWVYPESGSQHAALHTVPLPRRPAD
jgi:hypothetical protein